MVIANNKQASTFIFLGILGALVVLYGLTQSPAQLYYVIGAALLLLTATYFNLNYFIALELILLSGHGAILLGIGPILQLIIPILLCLQLLIYYIISNQLQNIFKLIGIIGIALLSIGFSYADPWIFFLGSLSIAVFSFYEVIQGHKVVLIWAFLNLIFMFISAVKLI